MDQQEAVRITDKRGKNKMTEEHQHENGVAVTDDNNPIPAAPQRRAVGTCFGVIVELDGTIRATGDITELAGVQPHRQLTFHDMYAASAHLMKDIETQETAMRVANMLHQQAQMAMDQARVQQQMSGINLPGL